MFGKKKKILGLDIGTRAVKGVVLGQKDGQVTLDNYFYFDLKQPQGGPVSPEAVGRVVADLVEGAGLRKTRVASCIEDREIQVVSLTMPILSEEELRVAVTNELEAQLGIDSKELAIDFVVVPPRNERSPDLEVHAFYAKLATIRTHTDLLEAAQLEPVSVECAMLAALETARFNEDIGAEETVLLVDSGETHTSVGLVSCGELLQLSTIRVGAGEINNQLMQQLGCTFENAELRKLSYRMEGDEAQEGTEARTIEQGYYEIIAGIHDTATYLRASRKAQKIEKVVVAGGGLLKEGAVALIEQSLGMPVTLANPLRKIEIFGGKEGDRDQLPRIGPMLHVAVGLALKGVA